MSKKLLILVLFVVAFTSTSYAGLFVEPYAGYGTSKGEFKFDDTVQGIVDNGKQKWTGLTYGGKAGFSFMMISLGADYMYIDMKNKFEVSGVEGENDITGGNVGAYLGITLPSVQINLTYFPKFKWEQKEELGHTDPEGNAFKLGVGFKLFPFVVLNIDLLSIKADKAKWASDAGPSGTMDTFEAKNNALFASLSFPLGF